MKQFKLFLTFLFAIFALSAFSYAQNPDVQFSANSIVITPPSDPNFEAMNVRIMSPSGRLVVNTRSYGDTVSYTVTEDGIYRWETNVVLINTNATMSDSEYPEDYIVKTFFGRFEVVNGTIINEESKKHSYLDVTKNNIISFVKNIIEIIFSSAKAADLTASSSTPSVNFDDTDTTNINPDWRLKTRGEYVGNTGFFSIEHYNNVAGYTFFRLENAYQDGIDAIWLKSNGDLTFKSGAHFLYNNGNVSLANGTFFIDKANKHVGIGTTTPSASLELHDNLYPGIKFYSTSAGKSMYLYQYQGAFFTLKGFSNQYITKIYGDAPEDSLVVDSSGTVVMKDANIYFSGSNTVGDGLKKLISLESNNSASGKTSDVGFSLYNAKSGFRWNFRTDEGSQGFSATKEGTGGAEFLLKNTTNSYQNVELLLGNGAKCTSTGQWVNASSREYKEDIKPLTAKEALLAFEQLKPVKYKFKRDKTKRVNVGFIAEEVPDIVATADRKGINSLEVVALLTKVVKEQKKVIEKLTKRIEKLEKEKTDLKKNENLVKELSLKLEKVQKRIELLHSTALLNN